MALRAALIDRRDIPAIVRSELGEARNRVDPFGELQEGDSVEWVRRVVAFGDVEPRSGRNEDLLRLEHAAVVQLRTVGSRIEASFYLKGRAIRRSAAGANEGRDDRCTVAPRTEVAGHGDGTGGWVDGD